MPDPNKQRYEHPPSNAKRREERPEKKVLKTYSDPTPLRSFRHSGDTDYAAVQVVENGRYQNYVFGILRIEQGGEPPPKSAGKFIPLPGIPLEFSQNYLSLVQKAEQIRAEKPKAS
jgi:hypothetical protein